MNDKREVWFYTAMFEVLVVLFLACDYDKIIIAGLALVNIYALLYLWDKSKEDKAKKAATNRKRPTRRQYHSRQQINTERSQNVIFSSKNDEFDAVPIIPRGPAAKTESTQEFEVLQMDEVTPPTVSQAVPRNQRRNSGVQYGGNGVNSNRVYYKYMPCQPYGFSIGMPRIYWE